MKNSHRSIRLAAILFTIAFLLAAAFYINGVSLQNQYVEAKMQAPQPAPSNLHEMVTIKTDQDGVIGYVGFKGNQVVFVGSKPFWHGEPAAYGQHAISVFGGQGFIPPERYSIYYSIENGKLVTKVDPH